jgi:hypothetical protein
LVGRMLLTWKKEELGKELSRAGAALAKVNGTVFKDGVSEGLKMLFLPYYRGGFGGCGRRGNGDRLRARLERILVFDY